MNYGRTRIEIPLSFAIEADFADIFEVRGTRREKRGRRLEDHIDRSSILLCYEGLDNVVRQTRIQCHPDPVKISPSELRFEFKSPPETIRRSASNCLVQSPRLRAFP